MIRVSIVTPAHNAATTLTRMFDSVARQRVAEREHIVVVDGSTDGTESLARSHAARDPRIVVLVQANGGASAARNAGLAAARGEWVLFLDADDTIAPDHLVRMLAHLEGGEHADVVCCGYVRCDQTGRETERYPAPRLGTQPFRSIVSAPPTVIHGVLARRSILQAVGGFDPELRTNEDWDLWLRLARSGARFAREPRQLAFYWNAGTSLTRDPVAMVRDVITVLDRARRPDPRVANPPADLAGGLELGSFDENILSCALWSAASDIGRGGNGLAAIGALPPSLAYPWQRRGLAGTVIDGLMVGSEGRYADLARRWPELAGRVAAMLDALAERCGGTELSFAVLREIEGDVARHGRLRGTRLVGRTLSVALTPLTLFRSLATPADTETVQFRPVLLPARSAFMLPGPALRPLAAHELRRVLAQQAWRRLLRATAKLVEKVPRAVRAVDLGFMGLAVASRLPRKLLGRATREAPQATIEEPPSGKSSTPGWDAFFRTEDPWNYASAYEQLKYRRTLELLPADRPIGRAIELACAEGMFTQALARRVGRLHATDISGVAIARAAHRCRAAGAENVEFAVLDFFNEPLGEGWDLIVSSEVLYYMADAAQLEGYAAKVEAALAEGGLFLHAHAFEVTDDPGHTGFDWDDPFGAETISRTFGARAGLERVQALTTDLYLIELYRRVPPAGKRVPALAEQLSLGTALDPDIAAMVVWNGAIRTRPQVFAAERTSRLPVLMYHRIADDGPPALDEWRTTLRDFEHQLRYLRRRGYRSISIAEWEEGQRNSASLRGRPILITFDDAYVDFHDNAWPILERNGFSAHMFVVTEKVGRTADWDAAYGPPAPLMGWEQIAELHGRGMSVGSHLATHSAADQMPSRDLFDEAVRSKAELERRLGVPVTTVAPPFGAMNLRVEQVLAAAGYTRIFDAEGGIAPVWGTRWKVPRIDIAGGDDIAAFAAKIGNVAEPPEAGDRP